jgi:hypothetical protein
MSYWSHIFQKYAHITRVCCGEKMGMFYNGTVGESEITWICMCCDNEIDCEVIV